ncbi:CTP2 [Auxenochlorella protothecoides x Auxenochlorella symbiontica]
MYRRNAQLIGLGVRVVNRSLGGGLGGRTPRPPLGGKGWRGSRQPLPSPSSTGQGDAPAAPPGTTREDVVLLDVDGMHCAGCVSRVRKLLEDQPAVRGASVSLATETALARVRLATPSHSSTGSKADELEKSGGEALNGGGGALEALGASLAQILTAAGYRATPREARSPGGRAPRGATARALESKRAERAERLASSGWRLAFAALLASGCASHHLVHALGATRAPALLRALASPPVSAALALAAALGPGRGILTRGARALARGSPDMDSLVALGAGAAFAASAAAAAWPALGWRVAFEDPAMLLGVVLAGRTAEERARLRAASDMLALQGLLPDSARLLLGDGSLRDVPAHAVARGDAVVVLPGDVVPVDGVVAEGRSACDESSLTGEAMPVPKAKGQRVSAGTLNSEGRLVVVAEAAGEATTLGALGSLIEAAQSRAAPVQGLADAVAGRFCYGVMAASAATLAFWAGPGAALFPRVVAAHAPAGAARPALLLALRLACSVLVVACPCALGLAAPTAVLVGSSAAARHGLLIRGGDILEAASRIDTVVFDKTGTLTRGRPRLVATRPAPGVPPALLLTLAAAVEAGSSHPLARAVVEAAGGGGGLPAASGLVQEPGAGVRAHVEGHGLVAVGSARWALGDEGESGAKEGVGAAPRGVHAGNPSMRSSHSPAPPSPDTGSHAVVHVSLEGGALGTLELADEVRPEARGAVAALRSLGLAVLMVSGDGDGPCAAAAARLGIAPADVHARVSPAGKAELVARLRAGGARVAVVGDGVNDAAALAAADVGVAMAGGVGAAADVAGVVLLGDSPAQVVDVVRVGRATLRKIRQNLAWAFGYNLIGIPLAAGALLPLTGLALTPSISSAFMGISSLAVMTNSLLLQPEVERLARHGAQDAGRERTAVPDAKELSASQTSA